LQGRVDDVVGRGDHVAEVADAAQVVAVSTERTDVGHGSSPGECRSALRPNGGPLSYRQQRPAGNRTKEPTVTTPQLRAVLADRLRSVEDRIAAACRRAGRSRGKVTLVAVTKTVGPEVAAVLPELGVSDLGESRPPELWRKAAALPATVRWHLVGHLQRNKVERTLPLVQMIHSVDSIRLLTALEQEAERLLCTFPVLLEVNASREVSKHGFAPE